MPVPVVPNQFELGKYKIVHKPTKAIFNFDPGATAFSSIDWAGVAESPTSAKDYRRDDLLRVAQQLLTKLPK